MSYKILTLDSLKWLSKQPDRSIKNVITGIPDMGELDKMDIDGYLQFFVKCAALIFTKISEDGYCIFIQTDRKYDKQLIDKSYILTKTACEFGFKLLWHKIVCQRDVGKKDLFRPTYSHMLCYSIKGTPGTPFEDVIGLSKKIYDNATPMKAAERAMDFIVAQKNKQKFNAKTLNFDVVDPFVGRGTVAIVAIEKGLSVLGIDIDPKQSKITERTLSKLN